MKKDKKWEELVCSIKESNNHAPLTIVITKSRVVRFSIRCLPMQNEALLCKFDGQKLGNMRNKPNDTPHTLHRYELHS